VTRTPLLAAVLAAVTSALPATAASTAPVASAGHDVTVAGTVTKPDAAGCGSRASTGCDEHEFAVRAPAGEWVTVHVPDWRPTSLLRVHSADGAVVAQSGTGLVVRDTAAQPAEGSVTFRQPVGGVVRYALGVSTEDPTVAAQPWSYRATVRLAGTGWDRQEDCLQHEPEVVPPIPADTTTRLRLGVMIVTTPALAAEVRKESAVLVGDYARLNIALRYKVVTMSLPTDGDPERTFAAMRARFGGQRPAGYDVVYAATDYYAGGVASCIGGVRWPERAFAMGQVHYTAQGVPVPQNGTVRMGHIAAHEIGHLLGAKHEFSNCVEAEPESAVAGTPGPCTVMNPAALTGSGEWSTLEAAYVRYYVAHYAGK
jgi:hypothetical protein